MPKSERRPGGVLSSEKAPREGSGVRRQQKAKKGGAPGALPPSYKLIFSDCQPKNRLGCQSLRLYLAGPGIGENTVGPENGRGPGTGGTTNGGAPAADSRMWKS